MCICTTAISNTYNGISLRSSGGRVIFFIVFVTHIAFLEVYPRIVVGINGLAEVDGVSQLLLQYRFA